MDTRQDALGVSSDTTLSGGSTMSTSQNGTPTPVSVEPAFKTPSGFASTPTTLINYSAGSGWMSHMTVEDQQAMSRHLAEKYGIPKPVTEDHDQDQPSD